MAQDVPPSAHDLLLPLVHAADIRFSGSDADLEDRLFDRRRGCGACHDGIFAEVSALEERLRKIRSDARTVRDALLSVGYRDGFADVSGEDGLIGTHTYYERNRGGVVQFLTDRDLLGGDWKVSLYEFPDGFAGTWHSYLADPSCTFFGGSTVFPLDRRLATGLGFSFGLLAGGLLSPFALETPIVDLLGPGATLYLSLFGSAVCGAVAGYSSRGPKGYLDGTLVEQGNPLYPNRALLAALLPPQGL